MCEDGLGPTLERSRPPIMAQSLKILSESEDSCFEINVTLQCSMINTYESMCISSMYRGTKLPRPIWEFPKIEEPDIPP